MTSQASPTPTRHRARYLALCVLLTAAATWGDYVTGFEVSFSPFYLVAIGIGTWRIGTGAGTALSLLSLAGWVISYQLTARPYSSPQVLFWNLAMELGIFLTVAVTLGQVRNGLAHERALKAQLEDAYGRIDREMQSVGTLQRSLLPAHLPPIPGHRIAVHYVPSTRAGGDYYDFFPLADGRLGLLVADASGHGASAAVVMAMLRVLLHADGGVLHPPGRTLAMMDRRLSPTLPPGRFLTACYAVLEPATGRLELALAGHPPPLLLRASGGIEALDTTAGPPLGLVEGARFTPRTTHLGPGDLVLFYTDGLTECIDPAGAMFGEEGLRCALALADGPGPERARDAVLGALERHAAGRPAEDDLTLVVLGRVRDGDG